jgi:putative ABC transport system permease protein
MMRQLAVVLAAQMTASAQAPPQQRPIAPSSAQSVVAATPSFSGLEAPRQLRTVAIDERLAQDAHLTIGDHIVIAGEPGIGRAGGGDTVVISAIVSPRADPSEVARDDYRVRLHLTDLLRLTGAGDRVDRFAVRTAGGDAADRALTRINASAFGFHAYKSADVAVGTSKTFQVVSRFHRAIAVITITASALFLLCILILRVDERRRDIAALRLIGISGASVVWSVVIEAALISLVGSTVGIGIGYATSLVINWHYRDVYRTPLAFALVTPGIVALAVGIAVGLGLGAGFLAATRMVRVPPLTLFGR